MSSSDIQLSPFQKEKLQYFFNYLEPDSTGKLDNNSLDRVMKRIFKFTKWPSDDVKTRHCREVYAAFFEILFEKSAEEGGESSSASLDDWYHIWQKILPGCKGMSNFPVWLRLMPRIQFLMIDRNGDGYIGEEELLYFYQEMINVPKHNLEQETKDAHDEMTDGNRYPLNYDSYEQIFANFLIGKTPYGPGKYIFGCFKHNEEHFQLIMPSIANAEDDDEMDIKVERAKRPKKFGVKFT